MIWSRAVYVTAVSILAVVCGSDVRPGRAQSPPGGAAAAPTVAITVPTLDPAYSSTATAISLGGVAGGEIALAEVSWNTDRGGHGVASGATRWWVPEIVLQPGRNVIVGVRAVAAGLEVVAADVARGVVRADRLGETIVIEAAGVDTMVQAAELEHDPGAVDECVEEVVGDLVLGLLGVVE